jgi:hypothetical protein
MTKHSLPETHKVNPRLREAMDATLGSSQVFVDLGTGDAMVAGANLFSEYCQLYQRAFIPLSEARFASAVIAAKLAEVTWRRLVTESSFEARLAETERRLEQAHSLIADLQAARVLPQPAQRQALSGPLAELREIPQETIEGLAVIRRLVVQHFGPETATTETEESGDSGQLEIRIEVTFTHRATADDLARWIAFQRDVATTVTPGCLSRIVLMPNPRDANTSA